MRRDSQCRWKLGWGWNTGIPSLVGDCHVRLTWGKSLTWQRLSPVRFQLCANSESGWEMFSQVPWAGGTNVNWHCSQNHTNITPGQKPSYVPISKQVCGAGEIKVKTILSWYLEDVMGHILLGKSCTLTDASKTLLFFIQRKTQKEILGKLWKALWAPQARSLTTVKYTAFNHNCRS